MAIVKFPGAIVKLIPHGSEDPPIVPCGLVFHVAVNTGPSLFDGGFSAPGVESHFYVRFTGEIEQYRDTGIQADAQLDGNSFELDGKVFGFLSVETAGLGEGVWTEAQITSLKKLSRWVHEQFDIPLRVCPAWNKPGYGYHTMFGAPSRWTPVSKTCPGPDRIGQFNTIIVPWLEAGAPEEEPDMQFDDKIPDTHKTVGDALVAAVNAEGAIEALNRRQARRHQRLLVRQQRLTAKLATATQALSDLPEGVTKEEIRGLLNKVEATLQEAVEDASDDSPEG